MLIKLVDSYVDPEHVIAIGGVSDNGQTLIHLTNGNMLSSELSEDDIYKELFKSS